MAAILDLGLRGWFGLDPLPGVEGADVEAVPLLGLGLDLASEGVCGGLFCGFLSLGGEVCLLPFCFFAPCLFASSSLLSPFLFSIFGDGSEGFVSSGGLVSL